MDVAGASESKLVLLNAVRVLRAPTDEVQRSPYIDLSKTVDHLKDKIKEKKPGLIYFDADLLKLYLAREGDKDIKALKATRI
ncbi:hypothetical protein ATCC90586_000659 [Pythium insidiosum]|nr:hypothetical protein ATCC90586_000659 [Pythium insidiosum]